MSDERNHGRSFSASIRGGFVEARFRASPSRSRACRSPPRSEAASLKRAKEGARGPRLQGFSASIRGGFVEAWRSSRDACRRDTFSASIRGGFVEAKG